MTEYIDILQTLLNQICTFGEKNWDMLVLGIPLISLTILLARKSLQTLLYPEWEADLYIGTFLFMLTFLLGQVCLIFFTVSAKILSMPI